MDYAATYGKMHQSDKIFSGYSIRDHADAIAGLVAKVQPRRILDYGCGKGYQYLSLRVQDKWGGQLPYCYDPGVRQLRNKPEGPFQGIICTDVMEHIEERDVGAILDHIFGFVDPDAHSFAYFCIACRPAKRKRLPDGRDVHVTIKPPAWWDERLEKYRRPGLELVVSYDEG